MYWRDRLYTRRHVEFMLENKTKRICIFYNFNTVMTQVVDILPRRKQGPIYPCMIGILLLMPWRHRDPSHQHPWYGTSIGAQCAKCSDLWFFRLSWIQWSGPELLCGLGTTWSPYTTLVSWCLSFGERSYFHTYVCIMANTTLKMIYYE